MVLAAFLVRLFRISGGSTLASRISEPIHRTGKRLAPRIFLLRKRLYRMLTRPMTIRKKDRARLHLSFASSSDAFVITNFLPSTSMTADGNVFTPCCFVILPSMSSAISNLNGYVRNAARYFPTCGGSPTKIPSISIFQTDSS